jgi:hypothetical protein
MIFRHDVICSRELEGQAAKQPAAQNFFEHPEQNPPSRNFLEKAPIETQDRAQNQKEMILGAGFGESDLELTFMGMPWRVGGDQRHRSSPLGATIDPIGKRRLSISCRAARGP